MKPLAVSALLLVTGLSVTSQNVRNAEGIVGTVTRLAGSEGVSDAQVLLVGPLTGPAANAAASNPLMIAEIAEGSGTAQTSILTRTDGRFVFPNLLPGQYMIRVQKEGYFGAVPDLIGRAPTLVTVPATVETARPVAEVQIRLVRGAAIGGRVRTTDGQTAANLRVAAYRVGYSDGRKTLIIENQKPTDDRGDYRLFWLPPGQYYLGASSGSAQLSARVQPASQQSRTFYPGVSDVRLATPLTVADGGDLNGIDIAMQSERAVKVAGKVVSSLPAPAGQAARTPSTFYLTPANPDWLSDVAVASFTNAETAPGLFELRNVLPGAYTLVTTTTDSTGHTFVGRTSIDVKSRDLEGITLPIRQGVEVKIRVFVDDKLVPAPPPANPGATPVSGEDIARLLALRTPTPESLQAAAERLAIEAGTAAAAPPRPTPASSGPANVQNIRILLRSKEPYPFPFDSAIWSIADDSGAYAFANVPEGTYTVTVGAVPNNSYVADIREGGKSIYPSGLAVGNIAPGPVDVIIRSGTQSIRGIVRDSAGKPAPSANVVLVPPPAQRQNVQLYRTVRTNLSGEFTLNTVPPGDYKLFAWQSLPNMAYLNAEFMAQYESRGQAISITSMGNQAFDLTLIPHQ